MVCFVILYTADGRQREDVKHTAAMHTHSYSALMRQSISEQFNMVVHVYATRGS